MSTCSCKSPASMSLLHKQIWLLLTLKGSVSVLATLGKNEWVVWDFVQGICLPQRPLSWQAPAQHTAAQELRRALTDLDARSAAPMVEEQSHTPFNPLHVLHALRAWKKRCGLVVTSPGARAENLPPSSHGHRLSLLPAPPTTWDCAGTESFSGASLLPYPFGEIPTRQFIPPDMDTKYEQTYAGPSNSAHVSQMTAFSSEPEMVPGALTLPRFLSNQSKG